MSYDDRNGYDVQSDQYTSGFNTTQGYAPDTSPSGFGSAFKTAADLLQTGIGAWAGIEATRLRYAQPVAQPPQFVNAARPAPAMQAQNQELLKWGLIAAAVFLLASSMGDSKG